ncbi:MAG: helix-hairpin-helix domain-containing protein [Clostridiales Family XIII bacterium]|nr:helix-hairpin-helix domain-containing protein [Clostridiales Family XIII bacterium]
MPIFRKGTNMQNTYGRAVDFRNPKHIKAVIILIAVCGIAALMAVNYFGEKSDAGGAGDVISGAGGTEIPAAPGVAGTQTEPKPSAGQIPDAAMPAAASGAAVDAQGPIFVDVAGAVKLPDVYELGAGSRVNEAIAAAGGLTEAADTRYLNRAVALNDGDRIYVPTKKEVESGEPIPASAGMDAGAQGSPTAANGSGTANNAGASGTANNAAADSKVNINTADSAALQTLNGVGPATAQKIMDYRAQHGNFAKIEDIKNVSGIGEKTFEKLRDYITV